MNKKLSIAMLLAASSVFAAPAFAAASGVTCASLPVATFQAKVTAAGAAVANQGYGLPMWATLVDSSGRVCAVAKTAGDAWLGSRVISAQKANTANAFSTDIVSISTANLYSAVQPGGSLYGLQHSNPVNTLVAYRGSATDFGTPNDPMVGLRVGGINVFGGGLALYNNKTGSAKQAIGAIGVSGDTSCQDHAFAWELRNQMVGGGTGNGIIGSSIPLGLVTNGSTGTTDNINYVTNGLSPTTGYTHPHCGVPALAGNVWSFGAANPNTAPVTGTFHN